MTTQHDLTRPALSVRGRFWINIEGVSRLGKGKIELLEKIRDKDVYKRQLQRVVPCSDSNISISLRVFSRASFILSVSF